jgi:beta-aspartyl-dipeptidase (metallo-type)
MMLCVREGTVISPDPLGPKDILIAGGRIEAVADPGAIDLRGIAVEEIDARGRIVAPGLIDPHVHILGGGGEGGPATRAPEIRIEDIIRSGVTTLLGCLGTDGVTRHPSSLLAKARALEIEGVSTFIFVGSYELPVVTITGSVRSDLILVDKVLGAGEIAISDHRSSQPTFEEIARLAAECRVGGMLGKKAGVLHLHLGDGPRRLEFLWRLRKETEIPSSQVIPTHVNRNRALLEDALDYLAAGGYMDLTAGVDPEQETDEDVSVETAVRLCLERGLPLKRVTVSSDSNGSLPVFDKKGRLIGLTIATQITLLRKFQSLVRREILRPDQAARLFSTNPALFYKLDGKGAVAEGGDADLVLFDETFNLTGVIAKGKVMMAEGKLKCRGTFSPDGEE